MSIMGHTLSKKCCTCFDTSFVRNYTGSDKSCVSDLFPELWYWGLMFVYVCVKKEKKKFTKYFGNLSGK